MTQYNGSHERLPKYPEPYWKQSADVPAFRPLTTDINVDVAIVGGGMSGITTAYLLVKEGLSVAIIEADTILNGTTGHTTAKVTAQHGLIYDELTSHFGEEKAKLYYEANNNALQFIRNTVKNQQIDCDFTDEDAYVFTNSSQYTHQLINEFKAYEKLGIASEYTIKTPLPFPVKEAVLMKNQAQFHPLNYLAYLIKQITGNKGSIYEKTTAVDIDKGPNPKVITKEGHKVACQYVAICSHFPFYDKTGAYFARMHVERSYVLGIKTKKPFPGGMYISAEKPTRSLRATPYNGDQLVLFGGEGHKTGHKTNTFNNYKALEAFADETFGIKEIPYRWSAQDIVTLDKIPYIGPITSNHDNILVATGYRKWGMTTSTAAAQILSDLILQRDNPYRDLFSPSRFNADPGLKELVTENVQVAKDLIEGKLEHPAKQPEELGNDEGAVVTVNGKRAGAYRDENGTLTIVDTTCTHMGCELEWNNGERTWDCPCHGSRFAYNGEVVAGPAKQPLQKMESS